MRATVSLLWKEYREQRWFLFAALAVFCGFPLIEATGRYMRPPIAPPGMPAIKPEFYSDAATGVVLAFGGLLACFVAIGSTTRDLREELHIFWRSRPVGVGRWMAMKYAAGLFTVLAACTIPVVMQFCMILASGKRWYAGNEVAGTLGIHTFSVILIFSIAFLLGCLVRHTTHAALLALAVMLVVYFIPVIVGPLALLSAFNLMNNEVVQLGQNATRNPAGWAFYLPLKSTWRVIIEPRDWTIFAAAMLGGSIAAAGCAIAAVRRDWRVEADRKVMHWSLGGVALLLFGATAFQVGSNLTVQSQYDLPLPKHVIADFQFDGARGALVMRDATTQQYAGQLRVKLCSLEMTPAGPRYGPAVSPADKLNVPYAWGGPILFRRPERPERAYLLAEESGWISPAKDGRNYEISSLKLLTIDLTGASADPVVHRLDLLPLVPDAQMAVRSYQSGNRLFVAGGPAIAEVDLGSDVPRIVGPIDVSIPITMPAGATGFTKMSVLWTAYDDAYLPGGQIVKDIPLPPIPNLPPRERLKARLALGMSNQREAFNGDLLISANEKHVSTYRLTKIDDQTAHFVLEGRREHTPLERLVGSYASGVRVIDGLAYVQESRIGTGISVYDVRDPAKPRSIGHFAAPKATMLSVGRLTSGELLLAADRLYVLKSPAAALQ
jgi:hypothetical protein